MFFKEYQLEALETLWKGESHDSRQIWQAVGGEKISRASIINFLEDATNWGILSKQTESGKGGYKGIYTAKYSKEETKELIKNVYKKKLDQL